ncbi:hypothetical protein ACGF5F_34675 [Streptomyces sp. NPDC047821]|uniref:hypothetical protein n=1 Tax=Streptomyces sp. NPDC047821 TaxID=3365488 RepID=UPI0037216C9F
MADTTQILVRIATADIADAETDGWVFLCIAGREFALDTGTDQESDRVGKDLFILGAEETSEDHGNFTAGRPSNARYVDPRKPQLDTDDLDLYPVYIRFAPYGSDPA